MADATTVYKAFDELALDESAGRFRARVAVFDTIDMAGDRIRPGAFQSSLKAWQARPGAIPVVWSHQWGNVMQVLGKVLLAAEDDQGLVVDGQLDLEHPEARRAYALLKSGTINDFSFAFRVLDSAMVRDGEALIRDITAAHVLEVGPCIAGMNGHAGLLTVKALDAAPPPEAVPGPVRPRLDAATRTLHLLTLRAAVAAGKD